MTFDALSVAAIAAELRAELLDGRVQQVLLPDDWSVALEVYARRQRQYLFACAHPETARIHLLADKPRRGVDTMSPFGLLLRKHLRGARLVDLQQPAAERILRLTFDGPHARVTLVAEAIGRYSNLVLAGEDGVVLDSVKRVGPEINRYRVVLPNHPYAPPPAQDKLLPGDINEYRLRVLLGQQSPDTLLRQALVGGIAGVSPLAAREIAFRVFGSTEVPVSSVQHITPLLEACHAVVLEPPQPCLVRDEAGDVIAFAAYPLTHLGSWEPLESMSAAVAAYYAGEQSGYGPAKAALFAVLEAGRERVARRLAKLNQERAAAGDPQALKQMGEAILAYGHQVEPGQSELVVEWAAGQPALHVRLDPALSPVENASAYFRRYRKAQRGSAEIPARIAQAEAEMEYLDQLALDLAMAENRPEIDAVSIALTQAGYHRKRRSPHSTPAARPLRFVSPDGFPVWVGKNALQNDKLTFRRASHDDIWLHARGIPGAHVVIQTEGRPVPERTVEWAAGLAAYFSRGRDDTQVAIDIVQRRYVHRLKGGRPGQTSYRHERTLRVPPQPPADL